MNIMSVHRNIKNKGCAVLAPVVVLVAIIISSVFSSTTVRSADCINDPTADGCPCSNNVMSSNKSAICGEEQELDSSKHGSDFIAVVANYINASLYAAGILAVAMIVYSGLRYVVAHGNRTQVEAAKKNLIFSVVGLIVAMLAFAITNFVLSRF